MTAQPVRLKLLLRQQHLQTYGTFRREYDKAARSVDAELEGTAPSRAQLYRWLSGDLKGCPIRITAACWKSCSRLDGGAVVRALRPAGRQHRSRTGTDGPVVRSHRHRAQRTRPRSPAMGHTGRRGSTISQRRGHWPRLAPSRCKHSRRPRDEHRHQRTRAAPPHARESPPTARVRG